MNGRVSERDLLVYRTSRLTYDGSFDRRPTLHACFVVFSDRGKLRRSKKPSFLGARSRSTESNNKRTVERVNCHARSMDHFKNENRPSSVRRASRRSIGRSAAAWRRLVSGSPSAAYKQIAAHVRRSHARGRNPAAICSHHKLSVISRGCSRCREAKGPLLRDGWRRTDDCSAGCVLSFARCRSKRQLLLLLLLPLAVALRVWRTLRVVRVPEATEVATAVGGPTEANGRKRTCGGSGQISGQIYDELKYTVHSLRAPGIGMPLKDGVSPVP
jgi:hypothetical protein